MDDLEITFIKSRMTCLDHQRMCNVLSTHIGISAIMYVRMHITGEVYVSFLHMMFGFSYITVQV